MLARRAVEKKFLAASRSGLGLLALLPLLSAGFCGGGRLFACFLCGLRWGLRFVFAMFGRVIPLCGNSVVLMLVVVCGFRVCGLSVGAGVLDARWWRGGGGGGFLAWGWDVCFVVFIYFDLIWSRCLILMGQVVRHFSCLYGMGFCCNSNDKACGFYVSTVPRSSFLLPRWNPQSSPLWFITTSMIVLYCAASWLIPPPSSPLSFPPSPLPPFPSSTALLTSGWNRRLWLCFQRLRVRRSSSLGFYGCSSARLALAM